MYPCVNSLPLMNLKVYSLTLLFFSSTFPRLSIILLNTKDCFTISLSKYELFWFYCWGIGGGILENRLIIHIDGKTYQLLIIVEISLACFQCKHDISSESYISEGSKICRLNVSNMLYRYLYESFLKKVSLDSLCSAITLILE